MKPYARILASAFRRSPGPSVSSGFGAGSGSNAGCGLCFGGAAILLLCAALDGCASHSAADRRQEAFDQGYVLGASDAVKRLYWAKQALERPPAGANQGRIAYYTWEEPAGKTDDGRLLAPRTVAVPVFVPEPEAEASAAGQARP